MTESEAKQLKKIREKIAQMKTREKAIKARENARKRKERTRRLIQIGALAEKYFDCMGIEPGEFEKLAQKINNWLKEIQNK